MAPEINAGSTIEPAKPALLKAVRRRVQSETRVGYFRSREIV